MKALVLGARGQDGTLLMSALRRRGHDIIGIARGNIGADGLVSVDLRDTLAFTQVLNQIEPDIIFHFAAVHGSSGTVYEDIWPDMLAVNVTSVHAILEYMRKRKPKAQLIYASSGKLFGRRLPTHIDSRTPAAPECLYGISKQTACATIDYYRREYGLHGTSLHLFNHESILRPEPYFIPKLVANLAAAVRNNAYAGQIGSLDFFCDWGSAAEYMEIAVRLAGSGAPSRDYIIARGQCDFARDLAKRLFSRFGLDYQKHIHTTAQKEIEHLRPYYVDCDALRIANIPLPAIAIDDVCMEILSKKHGLE